MMDAPAPPAPPRFDNSYARLPDRFFARVPPTAVASPSLIRINDRLAREMGLDLGYLQSPAGLAMLAGNALPDGAEPIAMAYAGHQFGGWSPQLGDGRAVLLGEVVGPDGRRSDIQLKGAGQTPFSRMGDGRAPLGPVLREYIISEAMAALGVPTSRALAAVATGEPVFREGALPGGVLARVAASHVRVGTFQYFAARQDTEALRILADHVIARHHAEASGAEVPYLALLERVIDAQAGLVAKWLGLGFIHGVMNTDNMTVSGETIDFGPCAFMEGFDPGKVFSSIDRMGRYAFGNQPRIAQWNLAQLAQSLLPLLPGDQDARVAAAQGAIDDYPAIFQARWLAVMRGKFGLTDADEDDPALIEDFLKLLAAAEADFTLAFRALAELAEGGDGPMPGYADQDAVGAWTARWRDRLSRCGSPDEAAARIRAANPLYIPRNHLVEQAIEAAYADDFSPFHDLVDLISGPYDEQPGRERYARPANADEEVHRTFCGT